MSVQIEKLREGNYINVNKHFDGRKLRTVCKVTKIGISAFESYIKDLNEYFSKVQKKEKQLLFLQIL